MFGNETISYVDYGDGGEVADVFADVRLGVEVA